MRLLTALCVAVAVVAFAVPAFAETQNVKISGDIGVAHVFQKNIDLADSGAAANENDNETFFIQQIGLNVEADLTDNVSTYVRIINERTWDSGTNAVGGATVDYDINLDEAYFVLKEMLYAPLTLKIGRQDIVLGRGFVIGNAGPAVWNEEGSFPGTITEVSDMTAFDAIRATLDYDPWTIDLIYSKLNEMGVLIKDDSDLYITNIGYQFTNYDAEAELYWILENMDTGRAAGRSAAAATLEDNNSTHTIGLRGSLVPFDHMNVWAEGALQFGKYASDLTNDGQDLESDREAGAFNLGGVYEFVDINWTPTLGLEYTYWSGENLQADGIVGGEWDGWNSLYPSKFDTYIAAFRNISKPTDFDGAGADATANNNGSTNQNQLAVFSSIAPMADITVDAKWTYLWYDEPPRSAGVPDRDEEIGYELDGKVTYDYTEDVEFAVAAALFTPGDYFESDGNDDNQATAVQIISSVKVDF